jgi:two-component system, chemotaxis family, protein-glutamate methylesterase/glutaminase
MIRVLVVDDSAFSRRIISKILQSIPDVTVVDTATDGQDALKKTVKLRPDLITLDLEMPVMDGFTFLRWLTANIPTPVIVVSSQEADENVFRAMDQGAIDFVVKPTRRASIELEDIRNDLIEKVLAIPLLAVQRIRQRVEVESDEFRRRFDSLIPSRQPLLLGIACSTGGPPAIQTILKGLPAPFPVPILIAQHMPAGFTALFAERLNKHSVLTVQEARDGQPLLPDNVYIAPGGSHLSVERIGQKLRARVTGRLPDLRYTPSADFLFQTMANAAAERTIAAVLTGMGDDGKVGMIRIKRKGGITLAESEKTAIVFGMPQEAIEAGVVDYILPLHEFAIAFASLCRIMP